MLNANQIECGKQVYHTNTSDTTLQTESDYFIKVQQFDYKINIKEYITEDIIVIIEHSNTIEFIE